MDIKTTENNDFSIHFYSSLCFNSSTVRQRPGTFNSLKHAMTVMMMKLICLSYIAISSMSLIYIYMYEEHSHI